MLRLHTVQAEYGDCLILEFGTSSKPKFILIDGGPAEVYESHLRPELEKICQKNGRIELAVLSHVDDDHITGLLDLMADLRQERDSGAQELVKIGGLWHNSFTQTVDPHEEIVPRLKDLMNNVESAGISMESTAFTLDGILQGSQLRLSALALGIPLNKGFPGQMVTAESAPAPIQMGDLSLRVIGPTQKNLDKLRKKWLDWLDEHEQKLAELSPQAAIAADRSVPNLSSIMFVAESGGVRMLLTGDGLGADLVQGLKQAKLLDPDGTIHVDVLKMPHHGSARNASKKFFQAVIADKYVFSANGRDGNPDLQTLTWLVQVAKERSQHPELWITNQTQSTNDFQDQFPAGEYGYTLHFMDAGEDEFVVE